MFNRILKYLFNGIRLMECETLIFYQYFKTIFFTLKIELFVNHELLTSCQILKFLGLKVKKLLVSYRWDIVRQ